MARAIDETKRRRSVQDSYNKEHHITPKSVKKDVVDLIELTKVSEDSRAYNAGKDGKPTKENLHKVIQTITRQMKAASKNLEFEKAAELRDRLGQLRQQLSDLSRDDTIPKEFRTEDMPDGRYRRKIRRPDRKRKSST
jgi:excinuclease ABC subunit B